MRKNIAERFYEKLELIPFHECWEWNGNRSRMGYSRICIKWKLYFAHRISYELFNGVIPDGFYIDHMCRNRGCVNPKHLRAVTPSISSSENIISPWTLNKEKTKCKHGHNFDAENTLIVFNKQKKKSFRQCRECRRKRCVNSYWKRKSDRPSQKSPC